MANVNAEELFDSGRSHALAAKLLFDASTSYSVEQGLDNPDKFAFNGTFSLSVHYLIGLGLELMLKAAYVAYGGQNDHKHLQRNIGHDLIRALDLAESVGFQADIENLREILGYLRDPYLQHAWRYSRPEQIPLPDVSNTIDAVALLDHQLCQTFGWDVYE